ncbi:MAG: hypothetical protein HYZ89_00920 [Candidatus Omnitrophica bacterium]|nr:hypothetical protein [Candidatus Omnitrophota bacterium]
MGKRIVGWVVMGVLAACPAMGYAAEHGGHAMASSTTPVTLSLTKDYTASPWTSEPTYGDRVKGKLVFGAKNLLLGWTELFTEPKEALDAGGNFFVGLGKGLKNGLENELGGVVHLVTFPVPQVDAPLPEGGVKF